MVRNISLGDVQRRKLIPMRPETAAIHAFRTRSQETGAVAVPIQLSTTFERQPDGGYLGGTDYSRGDNPVRHILEDVLGELEGGDRGIAFASGMAAAQAILQALKPGDHVLLPDQFYYAVRNLAKQVYKDWGLSFDIVNMADLEAVKKAVRPETKLLWSETPSNPQLKILDLQALAGIAHNAGALLVCDNTFATPILQNPLKHGVDIVLHATTKYIGGHSDSMGGVLIPLKNHPLTPKLRSIQKLGGGVLSPFDAWLALRGLETLPARIRTHCDNAEIVANWLASRPEIERVAYPGLETHPNHEVAKAQMSRFGGMLAFLVRGGEPEARRVANRCKIIIQATSLGGTHSLIEHRASIEGPESTTPKNLLRLSVGLEHPLDLIEDLAQALGPD